MTTIRSALAEAAGRLADAGVTDAEREASWLLAHALACSAGALRLRQHELLPEAAAGVFRMLIDRRAAREPIQYILGTEEFMGMIFRVTPAVLIPRLDTEVLVRAVAERLKGPVRVADIGTGSGAIAVGLATLLPEAAFEAVDLSEAALAVARENAEANGVAGRIQFRHGDLLAPLGAGPLDAIVSNPPYIPVADIAELMPEVREWEPHLALTPGQDGLVIYRRLAYEGPARLKTGGLLAAEVGIGQAEAVAVLFRDAGLITNILTDTAGIDRVVIGQKA